MEHSSLSMLMRIYWTKT